MKNKRLVEKLGNYSVQIECLVWLPGIKSIATHFDYLSNDLEDFSSEEIAKIFNVDQEEYERFLVDENRFDFEEFIGWLCERGKDGFIATLLIPYKEFVTDRSGYTCSYNRCYCPLIYADTFEELINRAIALDKKFEDDERVNQIS